MRSFFLMLVMKDYISEDKYAFILVTNCPQICLRLIESNEHSFPACWFCMRFISFIKDYSYSTSSELFGENLKDLVSLD